MSQPPMTNKKWVLKVTQFDLSEEGGIMLDGMFLAGAHNLLESREYWQVSFSLCKQDYRIGGTTWQVTMGELVTQTYVQE